MKHLSALLVYLTAFLLLVTMALGIYLTAQKDTADPRTETCRIVEIKGNLKGGNSVIRTDECGYFQIEPILLSGVEAGGTYEMEVSGLEIPVIAWYPTVHSIVSVDGIDPFDENVSPFPEAT